ncbi:MAG: hypothetical protein ISS92_00025 [Candidatus Omnitrophica bacterium]|nr:hypothetical protein [Candidatus Omnitrophota bacterium]
MRGNKKFSIFLFITIALLASFLFAFAEKDEQIEIDTLVISSREHTRMQPEIFYAFKDSAKKVEPLLKMSFVLFNPFQHEFLDEKAEFQKELLDLLNECVTEVMAIKKANPRTDELLKGIREYIKRNPKSRLSELHATIEEFMAEFEFLIIEPNYTYGAHPIFLKPYVTLVDTPDGANAKDIMETLYILFFIDAAFKQDKPIWGTCHGAQIGYMHAGGKLGRLFEYKENGYDVAFKKTGQKYAKEETWHITKMLHTHKKDSGYMEYSLFVYPVPEIFKGKGEPGEEMYMNKDFDHSLCLIEPIPDDVKVISYHPLSEYKDKIIDKKYEEFNEEFKKVLKNRVIIDAYEYKTMLGTQYHPQDTYDDLETSIIFEYLVEQLADRYKE